MAVQRRDEAGCPYVGFGPEGEHFALKLVPPTEDESVDDVLHGFCIYVTNIEDVVARAEELGATVLHEQENVTYVASLVPDETLEDPQPWQLRAVVHDPWSGLALELVQPSDPSSPVLPSRPVGSMGHVTLKVLDLDSATAYFTGPLGMTLHRKRSLVPTEPALSSWVSYAPSEADGTHIELRYVYGRTAGRSRARTPLRTASLALSVPDLPRALADLGATGTDEDATEAAVPASEPHEGLELRLLDQLAFLTASLG